MGKTIDWLVELNSVSKRFATYTLGARLISRHCQRCQLTVIYQGRPQDLGRAAFYHVGERLVVHGVILRKHPLPVVLASGLFLPRASYWMRSLAPARASLKLKRHLVRGSRPKEDWRSRAGS